MRRMYILLTGTRSRAYPEWGVRSAFALVQTVAKDLAAGQPVVIVHGKCKSGVDDMAERLAPEYGWTTEPHPADWSRCSPLCRGLDIEHRKVCQDGSTICPLAGPWRNQQMVDLHKTRPYRLGIALPGRTWQVSRGTKDCYDRAKRAGIEMMALDTKGQFFVNPNSKAGVRK